MLGTFIQLVAFAALVLLAAFLEYLDWHGRAEVLKDKHPKVWALVNSRPGRLVVLVACLSFLVKDFRDAVAVAPPPIVKIQPPSSPKIVGPPMHQAVARTQVEDRQGPVSGRVFYQDDVGNLNFPDPLYVRNAGQISIQQIAVHVYFSEVVALSVRQWWESTGTGYDEFPFELWIRANISLSPREKWAIPTLQGKRANITWTKPIIVKMEVFCGNPRPETVIFRIEKR